MVAARGGTTGFMSMLQYFPAADLTVITLLNQDFMLHTELFERLAAISLGRPWEPLFAMTAEDCREHPLAAFAGEYRMDDGVRVRFSVNQNGFFLEEEGQERSFEVYALDDHTGFAAEPNARLMFTPPTEDEPTKIRALYGVLLWSGERVTAPLAVD
jgi:hypothetical protein